MRQQAYFSDLLPTPLLMPQSGRALFLACCLALLTQCHPAQAQILHAEGDLPAFEVTTIKPWKRPAPPSPDGAATPIKVTKVAPVAGGGQPTARMRIILPISLLIASAYNIPVGSEGRLIIGPASLRQDSEQYEIQAKIDDRQFAAMQKLTPAKQREQVALMEQSLLAERFKLQLHFEQRELPVYSLVIAKAGPKLTPAQDGETGAISTTPSGQGMKLSATAITLQQFALSPLLTGPAGRQVIDNTGLAGRFNFTLTWDAERLALASDAQTSDSPSLFTALQQQLGLRLVPLKAPAEVIVIDHIEPPSAN